MEMIKEPTLADPSSTSPGASGTILTTPRQVERLLGPVNSNERNREVSCCDVKPSYNPDSSLDRTALAALEISKEQVSGKRIFRVLEDRVTNERRKMDALVHRFNRTSMQVRRRRRETKERYFGTSGLKTPYPAVSSVEFTKKIMEVHELDPPNARPKKNCGRCSTQACLGWINYTSFSMLTLQILLLIS